MVSSSLPQRLETEWVADRNQAICEFGSFPTLWSIFSEAPNDVGIAWRNGGPPAKKRNLSG